MKPPSTMLAAVYRGADDIRIERVPVPQIRRGELLVRVAACGVCPTDIKKIHHATVPPPRIFGHETAGVIAQVGAGVSGFAVGDRVALHHHIPCRRCHYCRHRAYAQCPQYKRTGITAGFEPAGGGYAEYVRVLPFCLPGVVKIPPRNSFLEGAMLEPVNTILKAIHALSLLRGDAVLVAGQGPIGIIFTRLLTLRGIRVAATDLLPARLALARRYGARLALRPQARAFAKRIADFAKNRGFDAAILCVPSDEAVAQARAHVRPGGQTLLFAHTRRGTPSTVDFAEICVDEKPLLGSYSADVTLQEEAAALVFSRRLDVRPLITHKFPLTQTARAVTRASHPAGNSLKVVVSQFEETEQPTPKSI